MVMMTGFVVLIIPSFSNIMALVGATCCTLLAFTLPGLFHMSIMKGYVDRIKWSERKFLQSTIRPYMLLNKLSLVLNKLRCHTLF